MPQGGIQTDIVRDKGQELDTLMVSDVDTPAGCIPGLDTVRHRDAVAVLDSGMADACVQNTQTMQKATEVAGRTGTDREESQTGRKVNPDVWQHK